MIFAEKFVAPSANPPQHRVRWGWVAYSDAEVAWLYASEIADKTRIASQANERMVERVLAEVDMASFTFFSPNISHDGDDKPLVFKHRGARR